MTKNRVLHGQSMLEALVAIGIIMTAVSSALTLITSSVSAEKESETGIVGVNLAREGIEVSRNIRDSNWLAGQPFDDGLFGAGLDYTAAPVFDPAANAWQMSFVPQTIGDDGAVVYRSTGAAGGSTVGLFIQAAVQPGSSVKTVFRRLLTLDAVCADVDGAVTGAVVSGTACPFKKVGVRIRSAVQWRLAGRVRTVTAEETVYDWK
ncbi:hypothetical protein HY633_01110 [Candidatus Uhrbacteria bacterium]|nr:hypothetical protein [Candidatus Uhrbacteria bacterium]